MIVVDLFAGPGGFDLAAHAHDLDPLGIEWDDAACATREAAGLRTQQADVSELDPLGFAPCVGLIGGPPCPAFSMAGKGEGRDAMPFYLEAIERMGRGEQIDRAEMDEACGDERAHLVLEPLRWALALSPRRIALEQVPPVLPLWEAYAVVLRSRGYSTATAVLSAEQFGVPQTRKRAFLLASLDGPVSMPAPTHQRYTAPRRRDEDEPSLFAAPEPERIVAPEDRELLPWVSMAEALGWDRGGRVGFPRRAASDTGWDADTAPTFTGANGVEYRERDLRAATEPAFALTEKARSSLRFVANSRSKCADRSADEPAPTITGGHDHNERRWVLRTGNFTAQDFRGQRGVPYERAASEPAPTIRGAGVDKWVPVDVDESACGCPWDYIDADGFCACCHAHLDDPAGLYAEQGDGTHNLRGCPHCAPPTGQRRNSGPGAEREPRGISEPGHHDADVSGSQQANAVRVTLEEAAALQSFPPGYPWQGTKTKRFEQVGNAVPPLLAWHVLGAVLAGAAAEGEAA